MLNEAEMGIVMQLLAAKPSMYLNEIQEELKQTKILCGQLNCSVKLANISIRCSSHPQGKSEARCENAGVLIGMAPALAHSYVRFDVEAEVQLPLPPSFFIVAIQ